MTGGGTRRSWYDIVILALTIVGIAVAVLEPMIFCRLWNVGCPASQSTNPSPSPSSPFLSSPVPDASSTPKETTPLPIPIPDACSPNPDSEVASERLVGAWFWQYKGIGRPSPSEVYLHLKKDGTFEAQTKNLKPSDYEGTWEYGVNDDFNGLIKTTGYAKALPKIPENEVSITYRIDEWRGNNHFIGTVITTPLDDNRNSPRLFERNDCRI